MAPEAWPGIETVLIHAYRLGRYHEQERAGS